MKVMISLPMNGRKDSEVIMRMKEIKEKFNKLHIEVVDSFINDPCPEETNHPNVYYLGRTILNFLSNVDAVYFDEGWEQARGCKIERKICEEYDIMILDKNFFYNSKPTIREINIDKIGITPDNDKWTITPYVYPDNGALPNRSITPCIPQPLTTDPLPIQKTIITCQNGKHFKNEDTIYGSKIN